MLVIVILTHIYTWTGFTM